MARSWSLAVILCVFALRMRTTSQQICSPMNSVPMVETNPPSTANVIIVRCTSVGPSNPISNPVWYLNGENMNESRCFQGSSPDNNQLTFTITPDCEGYLQCGIPPMQATCAVSRPKPVYAYPERTPGNPRTMGAVLGTDVVIPCDFVVSSLGNTEACWTFISEFTGDRRDLSCTTGPTYNLPISSVTSANAGKYFCQVTASNLPDIPRAGEPGPVITLKVVEPARAEGIKVSVNGDRYMFSVLSPSGSELKYTWFQNDTVTSSTTSSLTVPDLPRGTTRVKVSISNQIDSNVMFMDSSSTMFTDNFTIEVTHPPCISCQCASPISTVLASPLVPRPSTDTGTIVLIVVLVLITVFAFTVIFVLLAVTFYLATELKNVQKERDQLRQDKLSRPSDTGESLRKTVATLEEKNELEKRVISLENEKKTLEQENIRLKTQHEANEATLKTKDENLSQLHRQNSELGKQVAVLQVEKRNLERGISQSSHLSDETDSNRIAPSCTKVAKLFTKITKDIVGECPESLTPIFCLKIVRTIVDCLVENVSCNTDQFKNLMRNIRGDAQKLYDKFVDKKKQEQEQSKNLGEHSAAFDGDDEGGFTGMLAVAMDECQWSLDKLDDKLRELGVEVKEWVRDDSIQEVDDQVEDQVQERDDQVQETEDQVQEMVEQVQETEDQVKTEDQVQKEVDLDQKGDDLS